jgi:hypothetical protein
VHVTGNIRWRVQCRRVLSPRTSSQRLFSVNSGLIQNAMSLKHGGNFEYDLKRAFKSPALNCLRKRSSSDQNSLKGENREKQQHKVNASRSSGMSAVLCSTLLPFHAPDVGDVKQHHCQPLQSKTKRPCLVTCVT